MVDDSIDDCLLERPTEMLPMQWRNLIFDKNGKSHRGIMVFSTKQEAEARIVWLETDWLSKDTPQRKHGIATHDGPVLKDNYHYSMPMPELL